MTYARSATGQYDQLYPDTLDSEVILCPSLQADHWCLVVVYPATKRMVYLDSLFRGIGARRAFECVGNFIVCAMQLKGQKYGVDEYDFFTISTNDIEQQLNSVDCGVFVVKWAQHIAEGRVIDFKQRHLNDFRYSLILNTAENKKAPNQSDPQKISATWDGAYLIWPIVRVVREFMIAN